MDNINEILNHSRLINEVLQKTTTIEEAKTMIKNVVRGGKVTTQTTCPEGYHLGIDGTCKKTSPAEALGFKKRAIKSAKSRKKSPNKNIVKSREKSLKIRQTKPDAFWNKIKSV